MYTILKSHKTEANTEIRLAEIDYGYSVGVWDCDVNEYYPGLRIYKYTLEDAQELATAYYEDKVNKDERTN